MTCLKREGHRSLNIEQNHDQKICFVTAEIGLQTHTHGETLSLPLSLSHLPSSVALSHIQRVESLEVDAISVLIDGVSPQSLLLGNRYTPVTQVTDAVCDISS